MRGALFPCTTLQQCMTLFYRETTIADGELRGVHAPTESWALTPRDETALPVVPSDCSSNSCPGRAPSSRRPRNLDAKEDARDRSTMVRDFAMEGQCLELHNRCGVHLLVLKHGFRRLQCDVLRGQVREPARSESLRSSLSAGA